MFAGMFVEPAVSAEMLVQPVQFLAAAAAVFADMFVGVLDVIPVFAGMLVAPGILGQPGRVRIVPAEYFVETAAFAGMLVAPDIWGQPGRVLIDQPEIRAGQVVLGLLFPSILLILVQP